MTSNTRQRRYSVTTDNGSVFGPGHYVPEEVLTILLSHLPPRDLVFTCRLVCRHWCNIVDDPQIWRMLARRRNLIRVRDMPWFAWYWILVKNPFGRNLVKNGCGQDGLKHWKLLTNDGDQWKVERGQPGSGDWPQDPDDDDLTSHASCFATTYNSCSKEQIIDLGEEGAVPQIMDLLQPKITVSEWYCGRSDSRCIYEFKTAILDKYQNPIDDFEVRKNLDKPDGASWQKVTHTFENYGSGVRYIWLNHYGQDLMFWKGHFGSKMTGASVILSLPEKGET